jgi:hypothetical protein
MPDVGASPVRYDFSSEAERRAFLKGVEEGCKWFDYEVRPDDRPYTPPPVVVVDAPGPLEAERRHDGDSADDG